MAHKEYFVEDVLDILRRLKAGDSIRKISRDTRMDRKTISRYRELAKTSGFDETGEKDSDLSEIAVSVFRAVHASSPGKESSMDTELDKYREQLTDWLEKENLTQTKSFMKLRRLGFQGSFSSFYRYVCNELGCGSNRNTVRLSPTSPGEVAQIDFGRMGVVYDPESGKNRALHALVVTLCYSRFQYVYLTHSQTLEALIAGMEEAWGFFGGVPRRVILDNMKAAVIKADRYEPVFNRVFCEYSAWRGFIIDATVPAHPKGKGMVENQVRYVRENFFRGENFLNRIEAAKSCVHWCRFTAGNRIHGTTRKRPLHVFEQEEKSALIPLEKERFDTPVWARCKVHPDHHISFQCAYYSLPTKYISRTVDVKGTSALVHIYLDGILIRTHARIARGQRRTVFEDYPKEKAPYARKDVDYYIKSAQKIGEQTHLYMQQLLSGDYPWANIRQAQKLLRMNEKYGHERLETACRRSLSFGLNDVHRLEGMIKKGIVRENDGEKNGKVLNFPSPRFARKAGYFANSCGSQRKEVRDGSNQ